MSDLDTIMSGREDDSTVQAPATNEQPVSQPEPQQQEQPGQPRDPHGRFAPTEQQPQPDQPETPVEQPKPPEGHVPIQVLDARLAKVQERYETQLRQQAEQFQRQLAAFVQPQQPREAPKPPEFWENPDAFIDYRFQNGIREAVSPIQHGLMFNARLVAEGRHGEEVTKTAINAFDMAKAEGRIDRGTYERVMTSPNPFHEAVQWHKENAALTKYGTDPEKFIEAEVARRIAARGQTPPTQQPPNPGQIPTSFSSATNNGPATAPKWNGPRPLSDIMPR